MHNTVQSGTGSEGTIFFGFAPKMPTPPPESDTFSWGLPNVVLKSIM